MASSKKYSYYLRGNQIALIEENTGLGSGTCSLSGYENQSACENAGGTWTKASTAGSDMGQYKSPQESITEGLEIEYSYSPAYRTYDDPTLNLNRFYISGWTVVGGYLTFLKSSPGVDVDWTSSPYSAVTADTYSGSDNDYIAVTGSEKWNGLHRVQTAGTDGQLATYTKVSTTLPYWENQAIDFNVNEEIFDGGGGNLHLADHFSAGDYIFMSGCNQALNNGLFSVASVSRSTTAALSKVIVGTKYYTISSTETTDFALDEEGSNAAVVLADDDQSDINIYKAHRDFCYIDTDVDVMDDENFELDLPRYQANAVVYYLKAKLAEDQGDIESFAYNIKQFRAIMQRHESARIWGSRKVMPGVGAIR